MKILSIEFKNINSLRGTHKVDFTRQPFRGNSLFAITGPTGSGKSTLLDVISLALFNQIPRLPGNSSVSKADIVKFGAILTRNQKEAYAKVSYTCKNGIFTSKWEISTNRNGNLRDYSMEISDEQGNLLDLKKSEVPAKNEKLIGLSYNQFIKSVLLAQGEFAQFLKANKDERGDLLEKITGTGIYRKLGQLAFEKKKLVNQEVQETRQEIAILQQGLLQKEKQEEMKTRLAEKNKQIEILNKSLNFISKSIALKNELQKQAQKIEEVQNRQAAETKKSNEFKAAFGEKLQQHEKIREFSEEIRFWKQLQKEKTSLKTDSDLLDKQEQENKQQTAQLLEQTGKFTGNGITAENFKEQLESFTQKVVHLQQQREQRLNQFNSTKQLFAAQIEDINFQPSHWLSQDFSSLIELEKNNKSILANLEDALKNIDLQRLEAEKTRLKENNDSYLSAAHAAEKIQQLKQEQIKIAAETEKLATEKSALPQKIKEAEQQSKIFADKKKILVLEQENQLLRSSLEEHRHKLKDGEPCPLCGALQHPFEATQAPHDEGLKKRILAAEKDREKWKGEDTRLRSKLDNLEQGLNRLQKEREEKLKLITSEKVRIEKQLDSIEFSVTTNWKKKQEQAKNSLKSLEAYEQVKKSLAAVQQGLPLLKKMIEIKEEGQQISQQLKKLYPGNEVQQESRELENRWIGLQEELKSIKLQKQNIQNKLGKKTEQFKNLENELSAKIGEKGFETIENTLEILLPENEYDTLKNKREAIHSELKSLHRELKLLQSQREELRSGDVAESKAELHEKEKTEKERLETLLKEKEELNRKLKNNSEALLKIEKLKSQVSETEKQNRRWQLLDELIGDSKGKKFNEFAQDLTLSQLLQLANKRLVQLSDRYRMDKPQENDADSLVVIDEHMGGQRRSVKTLSGGETFILSLSMALALSDLASRNVAINSLFIDEGFGTLDPETLDQTLDTLEKLQAESSKTIGIISHVDSLKERISTQIQLKRNGQGYSSLSIS